MFCPKCGSQNPETGKFCRSCGTDLGNVSSALSGHPPRSLVDRKGKPISWEGSITKFATGLAFLVVSIVLGVTNMAGGRVWWFWMLIPAFTMMGAGIAQFIQLRKQEKATGFHSTIESQVGLPASSNSLPEAQTEFASVESRYKTGDLVPPSVTDSTTRRLEMDSEGNTMTLPKP